MNPVLQDAIGMVGEERNDVLQLRKRPQMSGSPTYMTTGQRLTPILRSSMELICLNASIAATYLHIMTKRTTERSDRIPTKAEGSWNEVTPLSN